LIWQQTQSSVLSDFALSQKSGLMPRASFPAKSSTDLAFTSSISSIFFGLEYFSAEKKLGLFELKFELNYENQKENVSKIQQVLFGWVCFFVDFEDQEPQVLDFMV
jgi:hypothetical protein